MDEALTITIAQPLHVERLVRHHERKDMFKVALIDNGGFVTQVLVPEHEARQLVIGDAVTLRLDVEAGEE